MNQFVGCCNMAVFDEHTGITFPMLVMYPTDMPSKPVAFGPFSLMVSLDALVKAGDFSLVMISHGSGGSHLAYRTLGLHLAQSGFVVGIPEHPFNNRISNEWQYTLENMTHRPRHIRLAIDQVLATNPFKNCLNPNNVAIIGHSVGGYTALAAAGGMPHTQSLIEFCQRSENLNTFEWCTLIRQNKLKSQPIEVTADSRVKAVVLFAPDVSLFLSDGALSNVNTPILMLLAERDYAPIETAEVIVNGIPNRSQISYRIVENAGHYSFLSPFPEAIKSKVGDAARDPKGFDRDRFHQELNGEVLDFLQGALGVSS